MQYLKVVTLTVMSLVENYGFPRRQAHKTLELLDLKLGLKSTMEVGFSETFENGFL